MLLARAGRIRQRRGGGGGRRRRDRRRRHRRRWCGIRAVVRRRLLRRDGRVVRRGFRDGECRRLLAWPTRPDKSLILNYAGQWRGREKERSSFIVSSLSRE